MKKIYRVEAMTREDYCAYMGGSNSYSIEIIEVQAESIEEAIKMAQALNPNMIINRDYVKSLDELETEKKAIKERIAIIRAEEEAKKAKKLANEMAKAEAMGMTLEEYRAKKNYVRKVKAAKRVVEEARAALIEAEERLRELEERAH